MRIDCGRKPQHMRYRTRPEWRTQSDSQAAQWGRRECKMVNIPIHTITKLVKNWDNYPWEQESAKLSLNCPWLQEQWSSETKMLGPHKQLMHDYLEKSLLFHPQILRLALVCPVDIWCWVLLLLHWAGVQCYLARIDCLTILAGGDEGIQL